MATPIGETPEIVKTSKEIERIRHVLIFFIAVVFMLGCYILRLLVHILEAVSK